MSHKSGQESPIKGENCAEGHFVKELKERKAEKSISTAREDQLQTSIFH